eukprot:1065135-Rhodomonas_salina.1
MTLSLRSSPSSSSPHSSSLLFLSLPFFASSRLLAWGLRWSSGTSQGFRQPSGHLVLWYYSRISAAIPDVETRLMQLDVAHQMHFSALLDQFFLPALVLLYFSGLRWASITGTTVHTRADFGLSGRQNNINAA